ncbi:MAG: hypothetical protein NHB32_07180 [Fischerella sp. CENA71]|nr:hypothetical protein [Fischerella sp. CENA71]
MVSIPINGDDYIKNTSNSDLSQTSIESGESQKIKLIYRANIFEFIPTSERSYRQPRAVNWRFRTPGKNYELAPSDELLPLRNYGKARAVNWRFKIS